MKRFVLVYNPISGHATFRRKLDAMIEAFQKRGCMLIPYRTQPDDHALPDFLREAAPDGVLSAGGDGTLHEVVNVLLKNDLQLPVAVIGSGTSNDFASYLQVKDDFAGYIEHIVAGRMRPVDIGMVNERYFVNVASAGMLTSVAHEVDVRLKHAMGKMAYYLRGLGELPRFRPLQLHIEADGKAYDEAAFLFVVVNSDIVGSIKHAAAKAQVDDGMLDLLLVRQCSLPELMAFTAELVAGRMKPDAKHLLYVQAKSFTISSAEAVESDVDGERGPLLPLQITTLPRAIQVFY